MIKYIVALVVALLLNASANLMIKFGMISLSSELNGAGLMDHGLWFLLRLVLSNWILLLGLFCFAANVVFYAYALSRLPISVAYPVMVTCGFAIIVTVAGVILGERLSFWQWVGVAAILFGVVLMAKDASKQMGGPAGVRTAAAKTTSDG